VSVVDWADGGGQQLEAGSGAPVVASWRAREASAVSRAPVPP